jgi:hypothetical protein
MTTIKVFDLYVKHGLKVIPLLPFSKKPFFENWQDASLYDPIACRRILEAREDYNLGLLLGDIVDVEGDSEDANRLLDNLIGDCQHPRYRSSKSVHHLFLTPDPKLTRIVTGKIEFRGRNHQSVIPPSHHEDGTQYAWMKGRGFPIPAMPPRLLDFFHRATRKGSRKPDHVELGCPACGREVGVHGKRLAMERQACREMGVRWECNKCRTYDLRPHVRHLKKLSR